jgi:nitronate monooxygenase
MAGRREFLGQAAALAAGLAACGSPSAIARPGMPTPRASALMRAFGLNYPISNAGMGGNATPELAIAISNAGGIGSIGTGTGASADAVRQRVAQTRAGTDRPFAVNYLLRADPVTVPVALDAGAPIVQFAWGIPSRQITAAIRGAGARMAIQVASAGGARLAVDAGADYIICQGTEAGGHVQASMKLYDVLPEVVEVAQSVPVLAAGGIATGVHIRRVLLAGAAGALIGTRFLATREAGSHDEYKAALVRAKSGDTVMTTCFQDGWVNAPHRVLRNRTLEMWEAAGCPQPGMRPGEGDVIATNTTTGATVRRYSLTPPLPHFSGSLLEMALYAGEGVDAIDDIPSAAQLVDTLWTECLAAQ